MCLVNYQVQALCYETEIRTREYMRKNDLHYRSQFGLWLHASGQLIPKDKRWTVGQLAVKGRGLVGVGLWPWVHRGGK